MATKSKSKKKKSMIKPNTTPKPNTKPNVESVKSTIETATIKTDTAVKITTPKFPVEQEIIAEPYISLDVLDGEHTPIDLCDRKKVIGIITTAKTRLLRLNSSYIPTREVVALVAGIIGDIEKL